MKQFNKMGLMLLLLVFFMSGDLTYAATSPSLGTADEYAILGHTYTNTTVTTVTGSIGYTTGPATAALGVHPHVGSGVPYPQAAIDQATALAALNNIVTNPCGGGLNPGYTFALGPIDLASDTTHGPLGVYTPGVYCINGAATIGGGGTITLNGAGTYIFRITGALNTTAASKVVFAGGAQACDVWWTPVEATTLGATSTFKGNVIDNAGITIGGGTTWEGRALAWNGVGAGTVTTDTATIFIPTVCVPPPPPPPICGNGILEAGEACDDGNLVNGDGCSAVCTVEVVPPPPAPVSGGGGHVDIYPLISIKKVPSPLALPDGSGSVTYTYTVMNVGEVTMDNVTVTDDKCDLVEFVSGDDGDSSLQTRETWIYRCTTTINKTTTNVATAIGYAMGLKAIDTTPATVVVGVKVTPPLIHVVKKPNLFVLPSVGGMVTYTYTVTNPGEVALSDVSVVDDKCKSVTGLIGDTNDNKLLDTNEEWVYTCRTRLVRNTANTATAEGSANGLTAIDYAVAAVVLTPSVVSPATPVVTPALPNTGAGADNNTSRNLIILSVGLIVALSLLYVVRKRQRN